VQVYSNCEDVELFLNGKSLGSQSKPEDASPRVWNVPFGPGVIKAIGTNEGKKAASDSLETAGKPAKIILTTQQESISNTWDDVSYIDVKVVDSKGVVCPHADNRIKFSLSGSGKIIAVDNGNPRSHEPYQASKRKMYKGKGIAVIRAIKDSGSIKLTATSPGLEKGEIEINIRGTN